MFNDMAITYRALWTFQGSRRLAQAFIEMNERMAKESLNFTHRYVELWFDGVRKMWQAAEEGRLEGPDAG
jgi:hypothetical protein